MSKAGVWSFIFRANGAPASMNERVGNVLRNLADKVDGRMTVAFSFKTTPQLEYTRLARCIESGFHTIQQSMEHEVVLDATEELFEELRPDLFEVTLNGQKQ